MITLIDFYADWCGPCQVTKPIIEKVMKEFEGKVTLEEVDVDKDQDKASEFGVMSIPTFILTKDGQELDRKIGVIDEATLRSWISSKL